MWKTPEKIIIITAVYANEHLITCPIKFLYKDVVWDLNVRKNITIKETLQFLQYKNLTCTYEANRDDLGAWLKC